MNPDVLLTAIIAIAGVLGSAVGWLVWRDAHRATVDTKDITKIKQIISQELSPVKIEIQNVRHAVDQLSTDYRHIQFQQNKNSDKISTMLDRLTRLETQIELWWKDVSVKLSQGIHSPNPERARVDELLERFIDMVDDSTPPSRMAPSDVAELKRLLEHIASWEPGQPSDFPIHPGEQAMAAILIPTMDHAMRSARR